MFNVSPIHDYSDVFLIASICHYVPLSECILMPFAQPCLLFGRTFLVLSRL